MFHIMDFFTTQFVENFILNEEEINYSSSTSTDLMTLSNQQVLEIDEVQAQIDQLNNQKNTADNQKKEKKIQQKIDDLQKNSSKF